MGWTWVKKINIDKINIGLIYFLTVWTALELLLLKDQKIIPPSFLYLDELVLTLMLGLLGYARIVQKRPIMGTPIDKYLLFYIITGIVSILVNGVSPIVGIMGLRSVLQYLLLYYVVVNTDLNERITEKIMKLMFGIATLQFLFGIFQILFKVPTPARRATLHIRKGIRYGEEVRAFGTMQSPNTLAVFLVIVILLALIFFVHKRFILPKKQLVIFSSLALITLVLTFSRQSIGSLILVMLISGSILLRRRGYFKSKLNLKKYMLASLSSIVVLALLYGLLINYLPGLKDRNKYTLDFSANYRVIVLKGGWEVFQKSPVIGVGPGTFGSSAAFHYGSPWHKYIKVPVKMNTTDSNILNVLVETGIIGLMTFGLVLWAMLKLNLKIYDQEDGFWKPMALFSYSSILVFAVVGLLSTAWENHQIAYYVWLMHALVVSRNLHKQERREMD